MNINKYLLVFLFIFLGTFFIAQKSNAATEFVSSIMQSGGDYSTLASWESAINTDLTVSSTKVYSVSSTTGTVSDGATVTGSISSSTKAKVRHNSTINSQVLVENIRNILTGTSTFSTSSNIVTGTGTAYDTELSVNDYIWLESSQTWQQIASIASSTQLTLSATSTISGSGQSSVRGKSNFQSGEQLRVDVSNYVTISNTGDSAIATAKIDGAWTSPDTTNVAISGWTTTSTNYIKIYTTSAARHSGKYDTNKYRLEITPGYSMNILSISTPFVKIDGLQIKGIASSTNSFAGIGFSSVSAGGMSEISNNIITADLTGATGSSYNGIVMFYSSAKIWNNIIYGFSKSGISAKGTNLSSSATSTVYLYNNTVYGNASGTVRSAGIVVAKNNISSNNNIDYVGTFNASSTNNISSDATSPNAGGTDCSGHSCINQTVSFVSSSTSDFHLAPTDSSAKDSGVDLSADPNLSFTTDIDGQTRPFGSAWDIGADEFVNTAPNAPVSLGQYNSGCSSSISTSTYWVSTSTVCFQGVVSDPNVNDLEKLQIELSTSTFSNTPNYTASTFTTSTATSSANATATSSITVSSLPEGNYKWQARLLDYSNGTSSFTQFNSGTNSFGIDTTAPTGTIASSTFGTITSSSIIINRPSTSTITESGSGLNQWQVRRSSTTTLSAVSTSTATTSDSSLTSNTQYTYDVRFIDLAGNISSYGATSSKYTLTPTPTNLSITPSQTSNVLSVDSFNNASSSSSGYYFTNTTNSNNSGWITSNSWTDTGLTCNTSYTYTIKYRNGDSTESATSSLSQTTSACSVSAAVANAGLPISILSSTKSPTSNNRSLVLPSAGLGMTPSFVIQSGAKNLFTNYLYPGLSHSDVKNLQSLLSNYPDIYPEGKITGYYGTLTKQAVQKLQIKYGITNESNPAYGYVGPKTRRILNLLEQINYLRNQIKQILNQLKNPSL